MKDAPVNIILSRTDSIGDMILTLPMVKILKEYFPRAKVYCLGREYTRPVAEACSSCDGFIELNEFLKAPSFVHGQPVDIIIHVKPYKAVATKAKQVGIQKRIGTTNRLYHWNTCNQLVALSRKRSNLHEAQLNLKLLKPFKIKKTFSFKEITDAYELKNSEPLKNEYAALIGNNKYNLILHPKSRGSAREWGLDNFLKLINLLDNNHYKIFISGTESEKKLIEPLIKEAGNKVIDISGLMPLGQFISFVAKCDGLVACSTGPLHIAAALGKDALGIYAPLHSVHPRRWGPVGTNAKTFFLDKTCNDCAKNKMACHCIEEIEPELIKQFLDLKFSQLNR